jgi:segregation and condensation protein A
MALYEQSAHVGIKANSEKDGGDVEGPGSQFGWVLRDGQRVEIHHHVEAVVLVLVRNPPPERAQVVAQVNVSGRLDAGQHSCHEIRWYAPVRLAPAGILGDVPYEVTTPVFEGPFDLLLHLITREQVDIYQVSLSSIVDAYVATLEQFKAFDLDVATEFLLIAAVLLELKARRLLPGQDDAAPEEELALWEERDLLLARLFECKTFKDAAGAMRRLMDGAARSFPRVAGLEDQFCHLAPDVLTGVTAQDLRRACLTAIAPRPTARVMLDHVAPIRASVAEALEDVIGELQRAGQISFRRMTDSAVGRLEVIVRFLAVLELYKRGWVDLAQATTFGELTITWLGMKSDDAPSAAPFSIEEYQG